MCLYASTFLAICVISPAINFPAPADRQIMEEMLLSTIPPPLIIYDARQRALLAVDVNLKNIKRSRWSAIGCSYPCCSLELHSSVISELILHIIKESVSFY